MDSRGVAAFRNRYGLTQRQLANALGVSAVAVKMWEGGLRQITLRTARQLESLAKAWGAQEATLAPPLLDPVALRSLTEQLARATDAFLHHSAPVKLPAEAIYRTVLDSSTSLLRTVAKYLAETHDRHELDRSRVREIYALVSEALADHMREKALQASPEVADAWARRVGIVADQLRPELEDEGWEEEEAPAIP